MIIHTHGTMCCDCATFLPKRRGLDSPAARSVHANSTVDAFSAFAMKLLDFLPLFAYFFQQVSQRLCC
jgi:hypothetical protein